LVADLCEENRLLRDFAYNVDPTAIVLHQHRMSLKVEGDSRNLYSKQISTYNPNQSVLTVKIGEFISKYAAKKRRSNSTSSTPNKYQRFNSTQKVYLYDEDKALLGSIKTEAQYIESQLNRLKANEDKLIGLMSLAYNKLEKSCPRTDPELKQLNRHLRQVLAQREEMDTHRGRSL
jgi:hypothetical protein